MQPKFIYIESYGCAANYNNSEIMKGLIVSAGLELTNNPEISDILIINTCIVKGKTENKVKGKIEQLKKLNKPLIIAGCFPEIRKIEGENIYCLGTHYFKQILNLIRKISEGKTPQEIDRYLGNKKEIKLNLPKIPERKTIGITQISEGCNGNCSYCITRIAKGKLFTYPEEKIIENIKKDIERGCREIWLTSQDNASYPDFPKLISKISNLKGNFKIRIGMMNPDNLLPILNELIEAYKNEKIYKFLHIPIQSGSNKVLKLMNRKYNTEDIIKIISKFRKTYPDIAIATDIIAGFPGESEDDFKQSLKLIEQIQPDIMNVSRYWQMKGTEAAKMKQVNVKIASKRAKQTHDLHLSLALQNNKAYFEKLKDRRIKVLIDDNLGTSYLARDDNYKLIIINNKDRKTNLLGKFVEVKLGKISPHYIFGELI